MLKKKLLIFISLLILFLPIYVSAKTIITKTTTQVTTVKNIKTAKIINDDHEHISNASKAAIASNYRVFGKKYYVLATSKNYDEQGTASWYGGQFNRRYTSSGERYNMYSMTAAHKTLPLSTYVLVTNLNNGRQVVVRINDRGPFVSNRLIDLSYGAAKKLGMVERGIVKVDIRALYTA